MRCFIASLLNHQALIKCGYKCIVATYYISLGQFSGLLPSWDFIKPSLSILQRLSPSCGLSVKSSSPEIKRKYYVWFRVVLYWEKVRKLLTGIALDCFSILSYEGGISSLKACDYISLLTEASTVSCLSESMAACNVLIWTELHILNLHILCVGEQLLAKNGHPRFDY